MNREIDLLADHIYPLNYCHLCSPLQLLADGTGKAAATHTDQ